MSLAEKMHSKKQKTDLKSFKDHLYYFLDFQRCSVPGCLNRMVFNIPPSDDSQLQELWISTVNRPGFENESCSINICSVHFKESDFIKIKPEDESKPAMKCLIKGCIPSVFSWSTQNEAYVQGMDESLWEEDLDLINDIYVPFLEKIIEHLDSTDCQQKPSGKSFRYLRSIFIDPDINSEEKLKALHGCKDKLDELYQYYEKYEEAKLESVRDIRIQKNDSLNTIKIAKIESASRPSEQISDDDNAVEILSEIKEELPELEQLESPTSESSETSSDQSSCSSSSSSSSSTRIVSEVVIRGQDTNDTSAEISPNVKIKEEIIEHESTSDDTSAEVFPKVKIKKEISELEEVHNSESTESASNTSTTLETSSTDSESTTTSSLTSSPSSLEDKVHIYCCSECKFSTSKGREILEHVQNFKSFESDVRHRLWCYICEKYFDSASALLIHIANMNCQMEQLKYSCSVQGCTFVATNGRTFVDHLNSCQKSTVSCIHCRKMFTLPYCLLLHMQNDCPFKDRYRVSLTQDVFSAGIVDDSTTVSFVNQISSSSTTITTYETSQSKMCVEPIKKQLVTSNPDNIIEEAINVAIQQNIQPQELIPIRTESSSDKQEMQSQNSVLGKTTYTSKPLQSKEMLSGDCLFICAVCQFRSTNRKEFVKHAQPEAIKDPLLWCYHCGIYFATLCNIRTHIMQGNCEKQEWIYQCGENRCKFKTTYGQVFTHHLQYHKSQSQELHCFCCKKSFTSVIGLIIHVQSECPSRPSSSKLSNQSQKKRLKLVSTSDTVKYGRPTAVAEILSKQFVKPDPTARQTHKPLPSEKIASVHKSSSPSQMTSSEERNLLTSKPLEGPVTQCTAKSTFEMINLDASSVLVLVNPGSQDTVVVKPPVQIENVLGSSVMPVDHLVTENTEVVKPPVEKKNAAGSPVIPVTNSNKRTEILSAQVEKESAFPVPQTYTTLLDDTNALGEQTVDPVMSSSEVLDMPEKKSQEINSKDMDSSGLPCEVSISEITAMKSVKIPVRRSATTYLKVKCPCCSFSSFSQSNMEKHYAKDHKDPNGTVCLICHTKFMDMPDFYLHFSLHKSEGSFIEPPKCKQRCADVLPKTVYKHSDSNFEYPTKIACLSTNLFCQFTDCTKLCSDLNIYLNHVIHDHLASNVPCPHCSATLDDLANFRYHISCHGPHLYACGSRFCKFHSYNQAEVTNHIREQHFPRKINSIVIRCCPPNAKPIEQVVVQIEPPSIDSDESFVCLFCNVKSHSKKVMKNHIYSELDYKRFCCCLCKMKFCSRKEVINHFDSSHQGQCISCEVNTNLTIESLVIKYLLTSIQLESLKFTEYPTSQSSFLSLLKCRSCSCTFSNTRMLMRHLKRCLFKDYHPYKCNICDYRVIDLSTLKQHNVEKHPGAQLNFHHGYRLSDSSELIRKLQYHHLLVFKCLIEYFSEQCGIDLSKVNKLGQKFYKCAYCETNENYRQNIVRHCCEIHPFDNIEFTKTIIDLSESTNACLQMGISDYPSLNKAEQVKRFHCEICYKKTVSLGELKSHFNDTHKEDKWVFKYFYPHDCNLEFPLDSTYAYGCVHCDVANGNVFTLNEHCSTMENAQKKLEVVGHIASSGCIIGANFSASSPSSGIAMPNLELPYEAFSNTESDIEKENSFTDVPTKVPKIKIEEIDPEGNDICVLQTKFSQQETSLPTDYLTSQNIPTENFLLPDVLQVTSLPQIDSNQRLWIKPMERYRCGICHQKAVCFGDLESHILDEHQEEGLFIKYFYLPDYNRGSFSNSTNLYDCAYCDIGKRNVLKLNEHHNNEHPQTLFEVCGYIKLSGSSKYQQRLTRDLISEEISQHLELDQYMPSKPEVGIKRTSSSFPDIPIKVPKIEIDEIEDSLIFCGHCDMRLQEAEKEEHFARNHPNIPLNFSYLSYRPSEMVKQSRNSRYGVIENPMNYQYLTVNYKSPKTSEFINRPISRLFSKHNMNPKIVVHDYLT